MNNEGTTILLVEQSLDVALALASYVYIIDQGRIEFEGLPAALRADEALQRKFLGV